MHPICTVPYRLSHPERHFWFLKGCGMAHILPTREYDKARLIKSLQAQRFMFEVSYESLTAAEMERPGVMGAYTVKALIAHVTAWDVRGTAWIAAAGRGEVLQIPLPGHTWADLDAINAADHAAHEGQPLGAVLAAFAAAFPPLLAAVESLSQAQILTPITYFNGVAEETMRVGQLVAWRYHHYREHAAHIRDWIRETREAHG